MTTYLVLANNDGSPKSFDACYMFTDIEKAREVGNACDFSYAVLMFFQGNKRFSETIKNST